MKKNMMTGNNAVVAIHKSHAEPEAAVKELRDLTRAWTAMT